MGLIKHLVAAIKATVQEEDDRHKAIMDGLKTNKELTMALQKEVQDLHDAVEEMKAQIGVATGEIDSLQDTVVDLQKKLEAANQSGSGMSAEDLAEVVAATQAISAGVTKIKEAMPMPVAQPVVDAAAAASDQSAAPETPAA